MDIGAISGVSPVSLDGAKKVPSNPIGGSFGQALTDALTKLNDLQQQSDEATTKLATGQPIELHEVMASMEQASLAFDLTLQVRNKLLDAYQEIMRTQV